MAQTAFRASSERLADETDVVTITGELDLYTVFEFERALQLNDGPVGRVVVDLTNCTFIDSTGLGTLAKAARRIGRHTLLIVATGPDVLRALKVTRLDRVFTVHPTLDSALNEATR